MDQKNFKPVPILSSGDLSAGATLAGDSINMAKCHSARFIVIFHALGGAATYVKVYSGATAAAATSALTFRYAFGGAATGSANADKTATWATSANLSVAHATYDNYMLVIDIDASDMDVANGEEWLTIQFEDTDTGATGNATVVAIVDPRYADDGSTTVLA
jgi:hypothetical protein